MQVDMLMLSFFRGWVYDFMSLLMMYVCDSLTLPDAEDRNRGTLSSDFPLFFFITVL